MTDPQLPAEEEARLRRLLADARHTAPMPEDVVSRLDEVLARLATEEPVVVDESRPDPVVVALDDARRRTLRRRVAGGLLAAAALVVGGVTVPQLLGSMSGSAEDASTAGEPAAQGESQVDSPEAPAVPRATLPALEDVQQWDGEDSAAYAAGADLDALRREVDGTSRTALPCLDTRWGAGRKVPIVFGKGRDQQPGVAVVRAPGTRGDGQVDLYVCGRDEPVGSVLLPTP